ncbi:MAG: 50S ribosomal protein L37e [Methanosarcinaceae archaeon]|nr:50S ribosomal protein L37e [Methanosarcinaceae archaeon]
MVKGTPSMGKRQKRTHTVCRRCGRVSKNVHTKQCTACGFGRMKCRRDYRWKLKAKLNRK